jgi:hypothetical protein
MTVTFKPQTTVDIVNKPMAPPNWQDNNPSFFNEEEHLSKLLNEIIKTPKQKDERGYFVQYYTTSTKKPYHWERYDAFNSVKPDEYGAYFKHAKSELEKTQVTYGWTGIKVVAFSFDTLNPGYGGDYLKEYCFEIMEVKKKTYINGAKASQEFLAKKGKMFTTKAGV